MPGGAIAPTADAETRRGRAALDDLQRDFQRVPNPEILGYVYPHRAEGMPVPGYYTAFPFAGRPPLRRTRRRVLSGRRAVNPHGSTAAFFKKPGRVQQLINRVWGDWPLTGAAIPLERHAFAGLFQARPAFADYLPLAEYDADTGLFLLDDGVSVGTVLRLTAADLDGRSPERLAEFNQQLDHALRRLPAEDEHFPVVAQFFLESREPPNIADTLAAATPPAFRESAYSQAWFAAQREHFELMVSPRGIFDDERVRQSGEHAKGWRAIEQHIHCCLFRKAPASAWRHRHATPGAALQAHDRAVSVEPGSRGYPGPAPGRRGAAALVVTLAHPGGGRLRQSAGLSGGGRSLAAAGGMGARPGAWRSTSRSCRPCRFPIATPERDRGVWRFGPVYTRYLTFQGIEIPPDDGVLTLDQQVGAAVRACPWDRLPPQSILTWTVVPRSAEAIGRHLDTVRMFVDQTTSDSAQATREELEVAKGALRQHQMIFSVQMGVYLRAASLAALDEATLHAENVLAPTGLRPIPAHYDLLADDSFVRNLPMVYDWTHERLRALRSRLTYTAHLAATLPFFGRSTGTTHACFTHVPARWTDL